MRPRLMAPALVAAACALALAPAGASAARHRIVGGRCAINIEVAPRQITTGDPVVIFGRLRCPVHAGQLVRLFHHLPGQPGFAAVQTTATDASGFYELARADGVVTTNRTWYVRARGVRSGVKGVRVAAQVTLNGPPDGSDLLTGPQHAVTFTGTVTSADAGARVVLQRQSAATGGDDWHAIDRGTVGAGGAFSITHVFKVVGDANVRVLVRSQGRNVPSPSNVLTYEISQAQNPNLTIAASQDPIQSGQSVVISGTLASGAVQPVMLFATTANSSRTLVAAAVADGAGNYTFPAQSPMHNTAYQVSALSRDSAILYEGVRDVLTARASATTVAAGQPVTFSGTVSPDHTGHVIYLERQNATGSDFHVVQVATVGSGSSYSITHRFYDAGPKVVRVFIPGGPENQGAASQVFTITVTPAPASTLSPDSSGSSSAPSAGQP